MSQKKSGVLLHPSSFSTQYGYGDIGLYAYRYVDFLRQAGQNLWQVLPLGPVNESDCPYQSSSAFAGNIYLISVELLILDGYVKQEYVNGLFNGQVLSFEQSKQLKNVVFHKSFQRFTENKMFLLDSFLDFCLRNQYWLEDYSSYVVLQEYFSIGWEQWPVNNIQSLQSKYNIDVSEKVLYQKFLQFIFDQQWSALKKYANNNGIKIIGDVPIYLSHDSVDVWKNPDLFLLDSQGNSTFISGSPPDNFSSTGQLWNTCLYRWEKHKENSYYWWIERLKMIKTRCDFIRLDHFRGFVEFWAIPAGVNEAEIGCWEKGPGEDFFFEILKHFNKEDFIVEDMGIITDDIIRIRNQFQFMGIKVLQCKFDQKIFKDDNYTYYTGTHDTDTLLGWIKKDNNQIKDHEHLVQEAWNIIETVSASKAKYVIFQIQDLLMLDSEYRMNVPGSAIGNWHYLFDENSIAEKTVLKLKDITEKNKR
ncbi:4-alpha-glucanotransferase [Anaerosporobacter sp.]